MTTADRCLALCEVLEREYEEITGDRPDPPPDWTFTPDQILEPRRLARRLVDGVDRCAEGLSRHQLRALVAKLKEPDAFDSASKLRKTLTEGLNAVLDDRRFYLRPGQFRGVQFRSQTLDRLEGPVVERNRLILEDTFIELKKVYDIRLAAIYRRIHEKKLSALCLSGGGIRSATFALGVAQGLARHGLLGKFHYLSTVSGGGYLGGWLSAWIKHTNLRHVLQQLKNPPARPLEPEPVPISHLRNYSNYLSPRVGLLSADTWTLVATYLRNVFLNWLVLIPVLVGLLTVPLVFLALVRWAPRGTGADTQLWLGLGLTVLGTLCGALAVWYVHTDRPKSEGVTEGTGVSGGNRDQLAFLRRGLLPLVLACVTGMVLWAWASRYLGQPPLLGLIATFGALGALIHAAGWMAGIHRPKEGKLTAAYLRGLLVEGLFVVAAGAAAGAALAWLVSGSPTEALNSRWYGPEFYTWLGVPALLTLILGFSHLYAGYTSNWGGRQIDATREWSARFSAWLLIVIGGWLAIFGLVILGPIGAGWLHDNFPRALQAGKTVTGAIGVVSGAFTLWKGYSAGTPGKGESGAPLGSALALATTIFVVFLVVLFAWIGREVVELALGLAGRPAPRFGSGVAVWVTLGVAASLFLLGLGSALLIDTNKFSLHAMYRARLIRAYLGASRPSGERDPNRFTGFDDKDNLHMRTLWPEPGTRNFACGRPPYHVVNAALNLVGGERLAWQERKAESFTFSPLYCGSSNHGYRPTWSSSAPDAQGYGGSRGLTLGTAMTISGAAVSPNMGYHSSTIVSFLLTLFNVRLGWWLGNPGHAGRDVYQRSAPKSSLALIRDEALGRTDARHPYVYLSDGGHFDNLGLYEMVLRRCHTIVVSDGGSDPTASFGDLGNAVRKIRIDLGIPVEFTEPPFAIYARDGTGVARPGKYCAVGRIKYGCVDKGAEDGILLYLKPAFYGDEPKDVLNYARTSAAFPHESTGDQFFSESQFESYRALGSHVIDQVLAGAPTPTECDPLAWLATGALEYASRAPGATDSKAEYLSSLSQAGPPRAAGPSLLRWTP